MCVWWGGGGGERDCVCASACMCVSVCICVKALCRFHCSSLPKERLSDRASQYSPTATRAAVNQVLMQTHRCHGNRKHKQEIRGLKEEKNVIENPMLALTMQLSSERHWKAWFLAIEIPSCNV